VFSFPGDNVQLKPWTTYANNPLQAGSDRKLIPQLRSYLQEKLPDYMVPAAFVVLDALPLTPNNKVNRLALPAPERTGLEKEHVAPRTPTEDTLAAIWAEVLHLESVGIHDNFFELGGHSLLATRVISRLCEAFRVELPLRDFFQGPTVADLAESVETLQWAVQDQQVPVEAIAGEREQGAL
jgi:acyl carrier protein